MADKETPVDDVLSMMQSGNSDNDIIRRLSEKDILLCRLQMP